MPNRVEFENGRLYVESRHSVLFFARLGDERMRCYVTRETLIKHFNAHRDVSNAYKYCLCAYDRNTEIIHEMAGQLIADRAFAADGAVVLTATAVDAHLHSQAA